MFIRFYASILKLWFVFMMRMYFLVTPTLPKSAFLFLNVFSSFTNLGRPRTIPGLLMALLMFLWICILFLIFGLNLWFFMILVVKGNFIVFYLFEGFPLLTFPRGKTKLHFCVAGGSETTMSTHNFFPQNVSVGWKISYLSPIVSNGDPVLCY